MSSSNPYGLAELNHFGSMQRVGGKAAGFINKKFFHPSSLRNQEKLWKAQSDEGRRLKTEKEAELRREEERKVEDLKKQMYLQGQGSGSDQLFASVVATVPLSSLSAKDRKEAKQAFDEFKKRKAKLKQEKFDKLEDTNGEEAAEEDDEEAADVPVPERVLAPSMYKEDIKICGHETIWGSWFCMKAKIWGFACCKTMDRKTRCPLAPEEVVPLTKEKGQRADRGKKRRRGGKSGGDADAADVETLASGNSSSGHEPADAKRCKTDVGNGQDGVVSADNDGSNDCNVDVGASKPQENSEKTIEENSANTQKVEAIGENADSKENGMD